LINASPTFKSKVQIGNIKFYGVNVSVLYNGKYGGEYICEFDNRKKMTIDTNSNKSNFGKNLKVSDILVLLGVSWASFYLKMFNFEFVIFEGSNKD
jgi:hypothetical protein